MSKLAEDFEKAIKDGDWNLVCAVYTKFTGKPISPPAIKQAFIPELASKQELYKIIKTKVSLQPIKNYTNEELLDIYNFNFQNTVEVEEPPVLKLTAPVKPKAGEIKTVENFTYINAKKSDRLLNMDKRPIKASLRDFKTYDDESSDVVPRNREPATFIEAKCLKCKRLVNVSPVLVSKSIEGDNICVCEKCGT